MYIILPSFTDRPILVESRLIALKTAVISHLVHIMVTMSSAYASSWTHF